MLTYLALGLALFFVAPTLSHSRAVHLSSGAAFGALAGVLLVVLILSRMLPSKRRAAIVGVSRAAHALNGTR